MKGTAFPEKAEPGSARCWRGLRSLRTTNDGLGHRKCQQSGGQRVTKTSLRAQNLKSEEEVLV